MFTYFDHVEKMIQKENIMNDEPCVVTHSPSSESISYIDTEALTFKDLKSKFSTGPSSGMIFRRYIKNNGDRQQIIRLINNRKSVSSFAIILSNVAKFNNTVFSKNLRYNIPDIFKPNCDLGFLYGKSIDPYLNYANSIVEFLSKVLYKKGIWIQNCLYRY